MSKTAVIGPALSGTVATSHISHVAGVMKKPLIKFKLKTVLKSVIGKLLSMFETT